MIPLCTSTFGVLDNVRRQFEYLTLLAALDCAKQGRWDLIASVMTWFKADFIADEYFRKLFSAILDMQERREPITDAAMLVRLPADGRVFLTRLAELYGLWVDSVSQAGHLTYYAQQVHEEYRRQHAAVEISCTADEMRDTDDVDAVLGQLPEIASKYAPVLENRTAANSAVMQEILAELEGRTENNHFRFDIEPLDHVLNGVPPTTLTTVGARSSNGKSVFLGQAAIRCAIRDSKPVLMFSMEMSQRELYQRWASVLSRQPMRGGNRREFIGGLARIDKLERDGLLHVFTGPHTVEQIAAEAMAFANRCTLGLIVVDYLQAVVPTKSRAESREQQVAHIAGSLKHLASKAGCPVLTASQLNKDGENNPRGSTLRESEAIFNYSNIVLLLDPEKGSERRDTVNMDIIIDKNRDGKKDVVTVVWEKPIFTIRDKDTYDMPNFDPALAGVSEADLPGIVASSRLAQPDWKD